MRNLFTYENYLNEGVYNNDWPHWLRVDLDESEGSAHVQYGFLRIGPYDTEGKFMKAMDGMGIKYHINGPGSVTMSESDGRRLQSAYKPG